MKKIPFGNLSLQYASIKTEIDRAIGRVLESGWFILGDNLKLLEASFAKFCGARYALGVASGTDALSLSLRACGVGWADEVITVANTAVATVAAISLVGARPLFVDIDPLTYTMDIMQLEKLLKKYFKQRKTGGVKLKAIIPVDLYGQSCQIKPIAALAQKYGLKVIEDAAQAHGAEYNGRPAGSFADASAFSFYPSKNLGAYGDAGVVVTDSPRIHGRLMLLRNYGQFERYNSKSLGQNSRLDEIQAAILQVKLRYLDRWNQRRRQIAGIYNSLLDNNVCIKPVEAEGNKHVYHLYVIRCGQRDKLRAHLLKEGIETQVHYPIPVHLQDAYRYLGYRRGALPVSEKYARQILSLPIYPELKDEQVGYITAKVNQFLRKQRG